MVVIEVVRVIIDVGHTPAVCTELHAGCWKRVVIFVAYPITSP